MMYIYCKPHSLRVPENALVNYLKMAFPQSVVKNDPYTIPDHFADYTLSKSCLIHAIQNETRLALRKKKCCLYMLANCPEEIKVIRDVDSVSFDVVIVERGLVYCWDYHDELHRLLNGARPKEIYDARSDTPFIVPQFFQRFLCDIWRGLYLEAYTIIWKDWFEAHREAYTPVLQPGFQEYVSPGKFSFGKILSHYRDPQKATR